MDDTLAVDTARVQVAVQDAARRYIAERRERVHLFCTRHFSVAGAWRIHRQAFGHDLWKTPANVLWAGPYLLSRGAAALFRRIGWTHASDRLQRLPPGFTTAVAREVEWLLYTELLELPLTQQHRCSHRDALFEAVTEDAVIARTAWQDLLELQRLAQAPDARARLEAFFVAYTSSRTAAVDVTGSLLSLAAGAGAFHQLTPGSLALGQAAAGALAQHLAIANFALGPVLGNLYYAVFPAAASTGLIIATVGGLMLTLGTVSALTGFVTDPMQQALGLHERRLQRLLDALEQELLGVGGTFTLRDVYVARVFDLLDVIRTAVRTLRA